MLATPEDSLCAPFIYDPTLVTFSPRSYEWALLAGHAGRSGLPRLLAGFVEPIAFAASHEAERG